MAKKKETLWHYCSNEAFLSIVESKEIWLAEATHSNDVMEGKWLLDNVLRAALTEAGVESYHVDDVISRFKYLTQGHNVFTFCLSEEADLLSQWRGYADDGHGVAIGFNKEFVSSLPKISLQKVEYEPAKQLELIGGEQALEKMKTAIDDGALLAYRYSLLGEPSEEGKEKHNAAFKNLTDGSARILLALFCVKNPAFEEENEWRLIFHNFQKEIVGGLGKQLYDPERDDLKVRSSRGQLIPHIRCQLPIPEDGMERALFPVIHEVKLGPKNTSDIRTIQYLIEKNKMGHTPVTKSTASYR